MGFEDGNKVELVQLFLDKQCGKDVGGKNYDYGGVVGVWFQYLWDVEEFGVEGRCYLVVEQCFDYIFEWQGKQCQEQVLVYQDV